MCGVMLEQKPVDSSREAEQDGWPCSVTSQRGSSVSVPHLLRHVIHLSDRSGVGGAQGPPRGI